MCMYMYMYVYMYVYVYMHVFEFIFYFYFYFIFIFVLGTMVKNFLLCSFCDRNFCITNHFSISITYPGGVTLSLVSVIVKF